MTSSTLERLRIEHERDYDTLTGLYNRRAFQRICSNLFSDAGEARHAALLMFNLDGLKHTNDTFATTGVTNTSARRVSALPRMHPARTICQAHLGRRVQHFPLRLPRSGHPARGYPRAARSPQADDCRAAERPRPARERLRGVAWYPESCTNLVTLRKYTDFAMYQVKHSQKGRLLEFDPEVYRQDRFASRSRAEFHRLVNEELITYYFQPLISAATARSSPTKRSCA